MFVEALDRLKPLRSSRWAVSCVPAVAFVRAVGPSDVAAPRAMDSYSKRNGVEADKNSRGRSRLRPSRQRTSQSPLCGETERRVAHLGSDAKGAPKCSSNTQRPGTLAKYSRHEFHKNSNSDSERYEIGKLNRNRQTGM